MIQVHSFFTKSTRNTCKYIILKHYRKYIHSCSDMDSKSDRIYSDSKPHPEHYINVQKHSQMQTYNKIPWQKSFLTS